MNRSFFILIFATFSLLFVHLPSHVQAKENCQVMDTQTNEVLDDVDCDVFPDIDDNCPEMSNPGQEDSNGNGIGDACDRGNTNTGYATSQPKPSTARNVGLQMQGQVSAGRAMPLRDSQSGSNSQITVTYVNSHNLERGGPGEFFALGFLFSKA
jgi:hypothetical protein